MDSNSQRAVNALTNQNQRSAMAVNRPGPAVPAGGVQLTPKQIVGIIRRHVLLIIACTVLGTIIGGGLWYGLLKFAPKYTARTAINVLPPMTKDPMQIGSIAPNKDYYYEFRVTKANFIKQQSVLQELLQRDKIRQTDWFSQFNNDIAEAVEDLEDHMGVSAQRDGNWIIISMTCGSKKEAALIVNEMVDLVLKKQDQLAKSDTRNQLRDRIGQQENLQQQLNAIQSQLDAIRGSTQLGGVAGNFRNYLDDSLEETETRYTNLASEARRIEELVETLRKRAEGEFDEVVREQMERDPIASQMRERIALLEITHAQLLARFGENHRRVKESEDALEQAQDDLAKRQVFIADTERKANLRNAMDQLAIQTAELESIQEQLEESRASYKQLDNIRATYEQSIIKRDELQARLDEINQNIDKLNIMLEDPTASKLQSVGPAPEPLQVSFPRIIVFVPAGFILGGMAGVGLAFLIELLNDKVRTPADAVKNLSVPLLGIIYHSEDDEGAQDFDPRLVVQQAPYSILSECYRQVRTNLRLTFASRNHKTLLVTSCGSGCGKTSVAANLASTLLAENKSILFVDTNFRRPASGTLFPATAAKGEAADFGLSNYLMGQCEIEKVIRKTSLDKLDVIDSGPMPANPNALLGSEKMRDITRKYRETYDYIILDGPPLLVSDSKTLATVADGTLLILNAEGTRIGEAQRAVRELREVDSNILGAVLVAVRIMRGGYFQEVFKVYQQYQKKPSIQPA